MSDPSRTGKLTIDVADVELDTAGAAPDQLSIEYSWWGEPASDPADQLVIVLLHEGLGSVAQWRNVPADVHDRTGLAVFAFNRWGYGASTPAPGGFGVNFMHTEGLQLLPRVLAAAAIDRCALVGHSDGGSISLIAAGSGSVRPDGVLVIAPHIYVERECAAGIVSIAGKREQIVAGLARHHSNPGATFDAWNKVWLHPDFQSWDIRSYLPQITCPVLAVQGVDDEYATEAMIVEIDAAVPQSRGAVLVPDCGHIAHRDQPGPITELIAAFATDLA
ncbi:MAG: alpha/beta fold hydrolase [Acidimicrobiales bacterium]